MRDECGMPLDFSLEECKSKGWCVDWLEALCDCWLNDCLKFDGFLREAQMLCPDVDLGDKFKTVGATAVAMFPEILKAKNPVDEACRIVLKQKRGAI